MFDIIIDIHLCNFFIMKINENFHLIFILITIEKCNMIIFIKINAYLIAIRRDNKFVLTLDIMTSL